MSKCNLNLYCQKSRISTPAYNTQKKGDLFCSTVTIDDHPFQSLEGHTTKKEAENDAADVALQSLLQRHPTAKSVTELIEAVDAKMGSKPKKAANLSQNPPKTSFVGNRVEKNSGSMSAHSPGSSRGPPRPAFRNLTPPRGDPASRQQQSLPSPVSPLQTQHVRYPTPPLAYGTSASLISSSHPQIPVAMAATGSAGPNWPPMIPPAGRGAGRSVMMAQLPFMHSVQAMPPPGYHVQPLGPSAAYLPSHPVLSDDGGSVAYSASLSPLGGVVVRGEPHQSAVSDSQTSAALPIGAATGGDSESGSQSSTFAPSPSGNIVGRGSSSSSTPSNPAPGSPLDFELELKNYCLSCGLREPYYSVISTSNQRFKAKVIASRAEFCSLRDFESAEAAKENATLVALATLGLTVLTRGKPMVSPAARFRAERPLSVQSTGGDSVQAQTSAKPRSLLERSSKDSASSLSEAVDSLKLQQLSLSDSQEISSSSSPAPSSSASAVSVAARGSQLQPPGYFTSSKNSAQLQQGTTAAQEGPSLQQQNKKEKPAESHQEPAQNPPQVASKMANPKLALNSYCQRKGISLPHYDCTYPDDAVGYIATVTVDGRKFTSKAEGTKRAAEATAARMALKGFGLSVEVQEHEGPNGHVIESELKESDSSIAAQERRVSYKNLLQEYIQKSHISDLPRYETERTDEGFVSSVIIRVATDKTQRFEGRPHANKKAAEQESAKKACLELKLVTV